MEISIHWFRRDLRLNDNMGLTQALNGAYPVLCLFILDSSILDELPETDARVSFIYKQLKHIDLQLKKHGSGLLIKHGDPEEVWKDLLKEYSVKMATANKDYEPYAVLRDTQIFRFLSAKGVKMHLSKDQVIYEYKDILKDDRKPYTVYTPYKNRWLKQLASDGIPELLSANHSNFLQINTTFPSLESLGFRKSKIEVPHYTLDILEDYKQKRDIPSLDHTSHLSTHLRFGTVSIRDVLRQVHDKSGAFTNELIWREFFMQILFHFPHVITGNFRSKYDTIQWRNNPEEFKKWCNGITGYPIVDAGMRELKATGLMHNRVRMITAGFLCKHLLTDWKLGEAWFASHLLDFDLSANNGNWQWAAGTGCDAAPYFRVFNPTEQLKKFDPDLKYVKKWVPEFGTDAYPSPIVDHKMARERAIQAYKEGIRF